MSSSVIFPGALLTVKFFFRRTTTSDTSDGAATIVVDQVKDCIDNLQVVSPEQFNYPFRTYPNRTLPVGILA